MTGGQSFVWRIRVYFEDTDSAGVVYHANHLKFIERARTEWLRMLGVGQGELSDTEGVQFVVREARLRLRQPARYDDELEIISRMVLLRPMRMRFTQQVRCREVLLVEGDVDVVCVDKMTFKPVGIPDKISTILRQQLPGDLLKDWQ